MTRFTLVAFYVSILLLLFFSTQATRTQEVAESEQVNVVEGLEDDIEASTSLKSRTAKLVENDDELGQNAVKKSKKARKSLVKSEQEPLPETDSKDDIGMLVAAEKRGKEKKKNAGSFFAEVQKSKRKSSDEKGEEAEPSAKKPSRSDKDQDAVPTDEKDQVQEEREEPKATTKKKKKNKEVVATEPKDEGKKVKAEESVEPRKEASEKKEEGDAKQEVSKKGAKKVRTKKTSETEVLEKVDFSFLIPVTERQHPIFLRHCLTSLLLNVPVPTTSPSASTRVPSWEVVMVQVKEGTNFVDYVFRERVFSAIDELLATFKTNQSSSSLVSSLQGHQIPSLRLLPQYAQNLSAAYNVAAKNARGDYLLLLADNMEIPRQTWPSYFPPRESEDQQQPFDVLGYLTSIFEDKPLKSGAKLVQRVEALPAVSPSPSLSPSRSPSASAAPVPASTEEEKPKGPLVVESIKSRVGVVGVKVVYGGSGAEGAGQLVYHAGIDFMYAKHPSSKPKTSWGVEESTKKPNVVVPYHIYQGYNDKDKRVNNLVDRNPPFVEDVVSAINGGGRSGDRGRGREDFEEEKEEQGQKKFFEEKGLAVSKVGMVVPRTLFVGMGGFTEAYANQFMDIDFCMRLQHMEVTYLDISNKQDIQKQLLGETEGTLDVLYVPFPVLDYYEGGSNFAAVKYGAALDYNSNEGKLYADSWGASSLLKARIQADYRIPNTSMIWNMECGTGQVLGFTIEAVNIALGLHKHLSLHVELADINECRQHLEGMGMPVSILTVLSNLNGKTFVSPEETPNDLYLVIHRDPGRYRHFIRERREAIPDYIIGRSMYETDRIPSDWLESCKELVNEIWVPSEFNIQTFTKAGVDSKKLYAMPEAVDVYTYDPEIVAPLVGLDLKKRFNFLTTMKWEKRKGWDLLLRAYFKEFTVKDDVGLVFLTKVTKENQDQYAEEVKKICYDLGIEYDELPLVEFLWDRAPFSKLPSLYKSVNSFVLPTHGEGWGLPLMEAMTMELPTIATNWSGNTEFMKDSNSFLVPVDSMVEANSQEHLWAKPSVTELGKLMRLVYDKPDQSQSKARQARRDVIAEYSHARVSEKIVRQLWDIRANRLEAGRQYLREKKLGEETNANAGWGGNSDWGGGSAWNKGPTYKLDDLPAGWARMKIVDDM